MAADHFTPARCPQKPTQISQIAQITGANADFADFTDFVFIFDWKKRGSVIGKSGVDSGLISGLLIFGLPEEKIVESVRSAWVFTDFLSFNLSG